jgi:hypothetical protein
MEVLMVALTFGWFALAIGLCLCLEMKEIGVKGSYWILTASRSLSQKSSCKKTVPNLYE